MPQVSLPPAPLAITIRRVHTSRSQEAFFEDSDGDGKVDAWDLRLHALQRSLIDVKTTKAQLAATRENTSGAQLAKIKDSANATAAARKSAAARAPVIPKTKAQQAPLPNNHALRTIPHRRSPLVTHITRTHVHVHVNAHACSFTCPHSCTQTHTHRRCSQSSRRRRRRPSDTTACLFFQTS